MLIHDEFLWKTSEFLSYKLSNNQDIKLMIILENVKGVIIHICLLLHEGFYLYLYLYVKFCRKSWF